MSVSCFICSCPVPLDEKGDERTLSSLLALVRESDKDVTNVHLSDATFDLCSNCEQKLDNASITSRSISFMKLKLEVDLDTICQHILRSEGKPGANENMRRMRKSFMDLAGFKMKGVRRGKIYKILDPCIFCLSPLPRFADQIKNSIDSLLKLVRDPDDDDNKQALVPVSECDDNGNNNTFVLCPNCHSTFSSATKYWESIYHQKHSLKYEMDAVRKLISRSEAEVSDPMRHSFMLLTGWRGKIGGDENPITINDDETADDDDAGEEIDYENLEIDLRLEIKKEQNEEDESLDGSCYEVDVERPKLQRSSNDIQIIRRKTFDFDPD